VDLEYWLHFLCRVIDFLIINPAIALAMNVIAPVIIQVRNSLLTSPDHNHWNNTLPMVVYDFTFY